MNAFFVSPCMSLCVSSLSLSLSLCLSVCLSVCLSLSLSLSLSHFAVSKISIMSESLAQHLLICYIYSVSEIRSHGTGFYQFSKDSNLREEQMEMLNKLREQVEITFFILCIKTLSNSHHKLFYTRQIIHCSITV